MDMAVCWGASEGSWRHLGVSLRPLRVSRASGELLESVFETSSNLFTAHRGPLRGHSDHHRERRSKRQVVPTSTPETTPTSLRPP
eukprot:9499838-Pyramimonas_sp.AAC.1